MKVIGIIPSRLKSKRLPNKALVDICGLPMIVHVFKRAMMSRALDEVYVATDSKEIFDTIVNYGGKAVMTSSKHKNGTERIAEAAKLLGGDIVVNIQGDEPLLEPKHITAAVNALKNDNKVNIAILVTPFTKKNSGSDIKAVLDKNNNILYCSRNDIPSNARSEVKNLLKMCFIVPFKRAFLFKYAAMKQTPLEQVEFNEYLRILENGYKIRAVHVKDARISVDTFDDLAEVRKLMRKDKLRFKYANA